MILITHDNVKPTKNNNAVLRLRSVERFRHQCCSTWHHHGTARVHRLLGRSWVANIRKYEAIFSPWYWSCLYLLFVFALTGGYAGGSVGRAFVSSRSWGFEFDPRSGRSLIISFVWQGRFMPKPLNTAVQAVVHTFGKVRTHPSWCCKRKKKCSHWEKST